jgi:hypothetical protein
LPLPKVPGPTPASGVASGEDHLEPPEVVAVIEPGETSLGNTLEEAVEGILDDILLIGVAGAGRAELVASQGHELAVVALP